ncbi:ABC transporter permease [Phreatobacter aquaticus]|uniref:ABC transporter permease n=1 Tax=Phreatobacter aquaticus TaxID=2570229 RepID=A0A4D7QDL1_9HYPH|nr:ABC transporter permease [Phreatobacter aquaticus]QCK84541.1 ABC transporter permease [Phreatobacter aquaticus]
MAAATERPVGEPGNLTAAGLLLPAAIFVAIGLLVPIAILFRYSLNAFVPGRLMVDALTIESYVKFFTDPFYLAVLWRTIRVAVVSTLVCLLFGFPLAYVLARTQSRFKNLMIMAVVLPLFVGNAVRAAGWMVAFGSKGFVNASLMGMGVISVPLEIMYTETAVMIGIIAVNLPFMVLTLQSVIEGINRNVEEAAFSLGAPPLTMTGRVLLPLAMPGILAGSILTFILAMNAYATPVLLGGPKFQTMGPLVFSTFAQQNNWPFGGAVSFILMTATIILTVTSTLMLKKRYG